jgi:hypothetical protein
MELLPEYIKSRSSDQQVDHHPSPGKLQYLQCVLTQILVLLSNFSGNLLSVKAASGNIVGYLGCPFEIIEVMERYTE